MSEYWPKHASQLTCIVVDLESLLEVKGWCKKPVPSC